MACAVIPFFAASELYLFDTRFGLGYTERNKRRAVMKKKWIGITCGVVLAVSMLAGCGINKIEKSEVTLFAAKSLNTVMEKLIAKFNETNPEVTIVGSYDSSGTLMEQIQAGAACDVFFSAAQKQMNTLEEAGYVVDGTRKNVVNNQVCVVTGKGSGTEVTGFADMGHAKSLAIADGSVPVGKYTRQALVNKGILPEVEDVSAITTQEISDGFSGIEVNECANVGAVAAAIAEGANEVGTIYYSDWYVYQDSIDILETVNYDLTGDIIYPAAQIKNEEAGDAEKDGAKTFITFLKSDDAKVIFDEYKFDTNVE